jgi:hypothetical protein
MKQEGHLGDWAPKIAIEYKIDGPTLASIVQTEEQETIMSIFDRDGRDRGNLVQVCHLQVHRFMGAIRKMTLDEPGKPLSKKAAAEQSDDKDAWVKTSVLNTRKQVKLPTIPKKCYTNGQYEMDNWQVLYHNVKTWADIHSKSYSQALDWVYKSPQEVHFPEFCDFLGEGGRELDETLGGYIYNELPQAIKTTLIRASDYEVNGTASGKHEGGDDKPEWDPGV